MPRNCFIAAVSLPRTGPLSVGTTPTADAVADVRQKAAMHAAMNSLVLTTPLLIVLLPESTPPTRNPRARTAITSRSGLHQRQHRLAVPFHERRPHSLDRR